MKYIPLDTRVKNAFRTRPARAYGDDYVAVLLENWRDVARSLRRSLILIVAFMVGFVLLKGAKSGAVTLGPLRLSSIWAILTVLPALVAALSYECVGLVMAFAVTRDAVGKVIREVHPGIYENDLHLLLAPTVVTLLGVGIGASWEHLRSREPGLPASLLHATSMGIFLCIVAGSLGFLAYAYSDLYGSRHTSTLAVSLSLLAATLFVVRTIALMAHFTDPNL